MIQILFMFWPLILLASLVGFVWLVVSAFRNSTLWGVLVLLLSPIAAVVFAIKYWDEAKKPFLVYAGSTAVGFVVMIAMFAAMGGAMMEAAAEMQPNGERNGEKVADGGSGERGRREQAELQKMKTMLRDIREGGNAAQAAEGPAAAADVPPGENRAADTIAAVGAPTATGDVLASFFADGRAPKGYHDVHFSQARQHIGKRVKIVEPDGNELRGTLAEANGKAVLLERHLSSGLVSFWVDRSEARSLKVYNP